MFCRACRAARAPPTTATASPTRRLLPRPRTYTSASLSAALAARCFSAALLRPSPPSTAPRAYYTYSTTPGASSSSSSPADDVALEKPKFDTEAEGLVWDRLVAELAPTALRVQDISGGCGSMYGIEIASERFRGLSMLKQQRLVNGALGDLVAQWHGVQIKTRVP